MTPAKFTRPFVEVGMTVHWFHGDGRARDAEPHAAIVSRVGDRGIDLFVVQPGFSVGRDKAAALHVDDPMLSRGDRAEQGCWRHTPFNLKVMQLMAELGPADGIVTLSPAVLG